MQGIFGLVCRAPKTHLNTQTCEVVSEQIRSKPNTAPYANTKKGNRANVFFLRHFDLIILKTTAHFSQCMTVFGLLALFLF